MFDEQKKQIHDAMESIIRAYWSACDEAEEAIDPQDLKPGGYLGLDSVLAVPYEMAKRAEERSIRLDIPFTEACGYRGKFSPAE